MTMPKKDVIQKLEDYMKAEGIKQIQLAERLEWSPSDVNNILKGRDPVGIKRLLHISQRLGIQFETEYGEITEAGKVMIVGSPPHLTEDDEEILEMMKPLSKKDKQQLKEYIAFLKAKQIKAG